jgi:hypothetical protein
LIKLSTVRWAEHVELLGEMKNATKAEGKRKLGKTAIILKWT